MQAVHMLRFGGAKSCVVHALPNVLRYLPCASCGGRSHGWRRRRSRDRVRTGIRVVGDVFVVEEAGLYLNRVIAAQHTIVRTIHGEDVGITVPGHLCNVAET
jgi:hypothetical protein